MKIGLTGGIATGKSTVASMLVERGALLVDADQVAREVVMPGEPALEAVASKFGQAVIHKEDGTLDRAALGAIVFKDKEMLAQLEGILHPAIRERMKQRIAQYEADFPNKLIVADIPLLYETGQDKQYEGVMVAYVPERIQQERLMKRNSISADEASRRIGLQMDIEEKKRRAEWVIDNSGTLEDTERHIDSFMQNMRLV
ncbi:dephospho-CoA kinase [Paenibacillus sp. NEAU-GSW1]|uniref:dephospho-CoA kinase n=1 Tax=Paenibacillus sp. NEAU-GSW1 TaxID=2682486 RepID=UPI0012E23916|nr:dephospho-CoA kinase [Paenibacillus sp. NEAU-GSW1]MUT65814.1 dephospho-CoA kinase [Paenibacillus sp. NEAU-GSW1]